MQEVWKPIKGYEKCYEISSTGRVRNIRNGRIKKPFDNKCGYLKVTLQDGANHTMKKYVHRLVAEAFLKKSKGKEEVNHKNLNKYDNNVNNLEWTNRKYNLQHSYDNGLKRTGESHGMHKLTKNIVKTIREKYIKNDKEYSTVKLAKKYGVTPGAIWAIVNYKLWKGVMPNV